MRSMLWWCGEWECGSVSGRSQSHILDSEECPYRIVCLATTVMGNLNWRPPPLPVWGRKKFTLWKRSYWMLNGYRWFHHLNRVAVSRVPGSAPAKGAVLSHSMLREKNLPMHVLNRRKILW